MERIFVTGMGIKAPGVRHERDLLDVLRQGQCTLQRVSGLAPNGSDVVVGLVEDTFESLLGRQYRRWPRVSRLAIGAAVDALSMAFLTDLSGRRTAVLMGTSVAGTQEMEEIGHLSHERDFRHFPVLAAGLSNPHSITSAVSSFVGARGPSMTLGTGCTGATDALLFAKLLLETGQVDVCIAGGADAPVNPPCVYGFAKLNSLCLDRDVLESGIPFSLRQEGFVMSEGAAVLVLERESSARDRGAPILAELRGVSANNDAISIHQADETGQRMLEVLHLATGDVTPAYVSSQALGLHANDRNDAFAHHHLFGSSVPITSLKGHLGHTMGAAGTVSIVAAILSMQHQFIPATIRTDGYGFEDLPIVTETTEQLVDTVAVTAHGYGGNNGAVLMARAD